MLVVRSGLELLTCDMHRTLKSRIDRTLLRTQFDKYCLQSWRMSSNVGGSSTPTPKPDKTTVNLSTPPPPTPQKQQPITPPKATEGNEGQTGDEGGRDGGGSDIRRLRLIKRAFWTAVMGGTLTAAVIGRKRRQEEAKKFMEHYQQLPVDQNFRDGGRSFRYKGFVFPGLFGRNVFSQIENFQARTDDVYVVSFPKTGTTWIQEIVYLIANDLDFKTANTYNLETRFPFLEFIYPGIRSIEKMPSPRLIKTHLPLQLLPESISKEKCKMIYISRNPKDVAVSFFHFLKMLTVTDYQGTFKELVSKLVNDELPYCPFWEHVLSFWERRQEKNVLFLKYEDLHKDLPGVVRTIAAFLNKELTHEEVECIVEHCDFVTMQSNPMVNYDHWEELGLRKKNTSKFMRKGMVGDWQNYFTPGIDKVMDAWIEQNTRGTGLQFDYTVPATSQQQ